MKKSLIMLAMAAAFAGCSNEETTEVSPERAINFRTFVNNNTKAVTEVGKAEATNFYVFGNAGTGETFATQLFNNEPKTAEYFWEASKTYAFAAYMDNATPTKNSNASYNPVDNVLTIADYTVSDANDLIVALNKGITTNKSSVPTQTPVNLTFSHMLSQAKFTFTMDPTNAGESYKIEIQNVTINKAATVGTGTFNGTASWTPGTKNQSYVFANNGTQMIKGGTSATEFKMILPQTITEISFKAILYTKNTNGEGYTEVANKVFTSTISADLTAGVRYNFTTSIKPGQIIDPTNKHKITFTVNEVAGWTDQNIAVQ